MTKQEKLKLIKEVLSETFKDFIMILTIILIYFLIAIMLSKILI